MFFLQFFSFKTHTHHTQQRSFFLKLFYNFYNCFPFHNLIRWTYIYSSHLISTSLFCIAFALLSPNKMSSMKKQKSVRMSGKLERGNTSKKILTTEESAALLKTKKMEKAILPIQMMIRRKLARARVKRLMEKNFERVFDPKLGLYFWYNRTTGQSQWKTPLMLSLHSVRDHKAAIRIQRIVRGFIGRFRARKVAALKYTRFYDAKTDKFYFMLNSSKKTFWKASPWLKRMNIPMPPEDQMLFESQLKIKELESLLKMKDEEIAEVRQKRFEELEPEVIKDKVANARGGPRSKHMDEWSVDDLAGWFAELRFDQYIPTIYSHK